MKVTPIAPGRYALSFPYNPNAVKAIKSCPGMKWNGEAKTWEGYGDACTMALQGLRLDAAATQPTEMGEPLVNIATTKRRPYQLEAVKFLLSRGREGALLADEMGLGKSCSAITAARTLAARTVVVVPSFVRGVWTHPKSGELAKWWPRATVFCPSGIKDPGDIPAGTNVVVIHYDILHAWAEVLRAWKPRILVLDEAQALQSETSKRSQAARHIGAVCEHRWALTGTPPLDRPRDLWNLVDTISPGRFGNFFAFGMRYCGGYQKDVGNPSSPRVVWDFKGKSNLEELGKRLQWFTLRRTTEDVRLELPPKTRQMIYVDVPAKARLGLEAPNPATLRRLLDASADAKMADAFALVRSHLEAGHRVVAFTYRRAVAEAVLEDARSGGYVGELIHGGVSHTRRGTALERLRAGKGASLLAATIDSTSTGIDLSYADVAVFIELSWKPQDLLQAEKRLHRFGQAAPVLIQYVIGRGSSDELVAGVVIAKLDNFADVLGKRSELREDLAGSEEDVLSEMVRMIEKGKLNA